MKVKCLLIGVVVLFIVGLLTDSKTVAADIKNLMDNGGFENGTSAPWSIGGSIKDAGGVGATMAVVNNLKGAKVPEDPIEGKFCLLVTVEKGAAAAGAVQFMTSKHPPVYEKGKVYTFSAFIKSDDSMQFHLNVSGGSEDGFKPSFQSAVFVMTDTWKEYFLTTGAMDFQPVSTRAKFFVGYGPGAFWVDDIKVYEGKYVPTPVSTKVQAVVMTADKLATTWANIKAR